jgi:hypothetical protein
MIFSHLLPCLLVSYLSELIHGESAQDQAESELQAPEGLSYVFGPVKAHRERRSIFGFLDFLQRNCGVFVMDNNK